jgi:hypothetical protein
MPRKAAAKKTNNNVEALLPEEAAVVAPKKRKAPAKKAPAPPPPPPPEENNAEVEVQPVPARRWRTCKYFVHEEYHKTLSSRPKFEHVVCTSVVGFNIAPKLIWRFINSLVHVVGAIISTLVGAKKLMMGSAFRRSLTTCYLLGLRRGLCERRQRCSSTTHLCSSMEINSHRTRNKKCTLNKLLATRQRLSRYDHCHIVSV